jgi:hypothetical protein
MLPARPERNFSISHLWLLSPVVCCCYVLLLLLLLRLLLCRRACTLQRYQGG